MLNLFMFQAKMKMQEWINRFFKDENGDTNFISILIVLGIVIVLYVVFKGQIESILNVVKNQLNSLCYLKMG